MQDIIKNYLDNLKAEITSINRLSVLISLSKYLQEQHNACIISEKYYLIEVLTTNEQYKQLQQEIIECEINKAYLLTK